MRPFGNDITNIANNSGAGNGDDNGNDNNRDRDRNNDDENDNEDPDRGNSDSSGNEATSETEADPRIPPHIARIGGIVTFSPIAGRGVIRVVHRCEAAKENRKLDLSQCELMQIPDAVYHLMRNTELKTCNFSGNVLKKVTPKFALKFSAITDLNLSHNQLSRLPDEFSSLSELTTLNISHNSFIVLPQVVFKLKKLANLDAQHNAIFEIDTEEAISSDCLAVVDLRNNPISKNCRDKLQDIKTSFRLELSEEVEDDW
ncbi:leucine-rich repeat-containing protein 20 isoform X1 [Drosophila sulfurigaster albostrigata]|uniref:Leucine-rich repeat-containing protein 20 isoform X1 n=1 Tax=Drosophila albomicans TaxID=7291 RepID=A0A6P8XQD9_DROAB|nr:leucine-rich repeat-containing protein 20 isoform X1 [Drosophila albomicans]XP_060663949.1 LOW QUALITY PROTEIN: leucine-rich repeat-containing protein 20 [Drosophila nasuta]XP_062138744.1 leucine-rich repeat-containing protein 20 isoform X1 [Drosophila sulfurigaster albostrigata]